MKSILTLTLLSLVSFTAIAQHQDHADHLETLILHYMEAKNALVQDNFETAKKHLRAFSEGVHSSREMNEHEEHAEKHAIHHAKMEVALQEAIEAEDIKALRFAFKKISGELIAAVQNQDFEGTLFTQYCPMYEGRSSWLSSEEEVQNPFFGQSMHSCGGSSELINENPDES